MYVILPTLPDPTDIVVQGNQSAQTSVLSCPTGYWPILQGEIITAELGVPPIPSAMIGQHDWYGIKPRLIGPMVVSGGQLVMLQIGAVSVNPIIDPIQQFLNSQLTLDATGAISAAYVMLNGGGADPGQSYIVQGDDVYGDVYPATLPPPQVVMSGIQGTLTNPVLSVSFGQVLQDTFNDSAMRYAISGITRDKSGNPLSGVRVMAFNYDKFNMNYPLNSIVGDTVSDAGGNYSMQIVYNSPHYMVIAYLTGSPDVVGLTTNDIQPVAIG